jgi:TRAP-type C4-dicarboxylate transport system permease small subunit
MKKLEVFIERISSWFNWIALVALSVMLIIVTIDIVGSKVFSMPLPGAMDLTSLLCVLVIGFAMPLSYRMGRHIKVDFISNLCPAFIQRVMRSISFFLCTVFFILVFWRIFAYANDLLEYGERSITIKLPLYPFGYALALAFLPLLVMVPVQLINLWKRSGE